MSYPWKKSTPNVVYISGGSSGIGLEFAKRLAKEGASIAIFNRREAPHVIEQLEQLAVNQEQKFYAYTADVSDVTTLEQAFSQAANDIGSPDLAVNSAGIAIANPFAELAGEDFQRVVNINLVGSRNFAAALLPHLQPGSHIVLVASIAGLVPNFAYAAYCSSKFGTVGLAEVLRLELKLDNIDVSVCCPAEINTPLVEEERKTLHPVSAAMKDFVGTMEVEPACDSMLKAIARRRFMIIPGLMPRISAWLNQFMPWLARWISDQLANRAMKQYKRNE